MVTAEKVVIIGGGLGGAKAAEALRDQGYAGTVDLIAAEDHLPYERPPLSKQHLAGASPFEDAVVHPESWYRENGITLHRATRATAIDAPGHRVTLDDGTSLPYDKLVLATGSSVRHLRMDGAEADNVHYLRTVEESDAIRETFGAGRRLTIVGGGWIGLEVAAAARDAGTTVTILEAAELPLQSVLGAEIARVFVDLHTSHGVDLRTGVRLSRLVMADGRVVAVELEGGERIDTDAVVIGIGVAPRIDIAEEAGISVDNGILVDASLRSSDPDIYAVGDIANQDHPVLGRRVRVEHWATALNQPAAAVSALLGHDTRYTELPYFFSDQYDLGCEYIGYAPPGSYDRVVVRGSLEAREFVAFWLDDADRIVAAMAVNVWDVLDEIKPLIAERKRVDPDRLIDPDVPYAQL